MSFKISSSAKPILRSASRASIESYFAALPSPLREQEWLGASNRYRKTCTTTFENDAEVSRKLKQPLSKHQHRHLRAYVAASAPGHVIDGWSFLGRSLDSALRGDTYSAAHFAYYAELRAAMSLLASEGIGVFSRIHAVVGANETTRFPTLKSGIGTHSLVWPLLQYWSTLSRSGYLIDELIQPEHVRLSSWLYEMKCPVQISAIGKSWLGSWGIDLSSIRKDHDTRNLASYRPSVFRYPSSYGAANTIEFISMLWKLFEPGTGRRFPAIERHLLKQAWKAGGAAAPAQNDIERIGLSSAEARSWANFLSSNDTPFLFSLAESTKPIDESTCHLRVISRAALLLFIASGSSRQLLLKAGYSTDTTAFWWEQYGKDRGLWPKNGCPDDPLDAWADVDDATNELVSWSNANTGASLHDLWQQHQQHIHMLGAFELIGIWSLLP